MIDKKLVLTVGGVNYSATVENHNGKRIARIQDGGLAAIIRQSKDLPITLNTNLKSDLNSTITPDTYISGGNTYIGYLNNAFPNTGGTLETPILDTEWGLTPTITSFYAVANNSNVASHAEIHLSYLSPEYLGRQLTIVGDGITETATVKSTADGSGIYVETSQVFGQWLYDACSESYVYIDILFAGESPYPAPYVFVDSYSSTVIYNQANSQGNTSIPSDLIKSISVSNKVVTIELHAGQFSKPQELTISDLLINGVDKQVGNIVTALKNNTSATIKNDKLADALSLAPSKYLPIFKWQIGQKMSHVFDFLVNGDKVTWDCSEDKDTNNFKLATLGEDTAKWNGLQENNIEGVTFTYVPVPYPGKMMADVIFDSPFNYEGWYNNSLYLSTVLNGTKKGDVVEVECGILSGEEWIIGKGNAVATSTYVFLNCGDATFASMFKPNGNKTVTSYCVIKVNDKYITPTFSPKDFFNHADGSVANESLTMWLNPTAISKVGQTVTFTVKHDNITTDYTGIITQSGRKVGIDFEQTKDSSDNRLSTLLHQLIKKGLSFEFDVNVSGDNVTTNSIFALGSKEGNTITIEDQQNDAILLAPLDKSRKGHVVKITSEIGTDVVTIIIGETKTSDKRK